jgi:hypothetical protein
MKNITEFKDAHFMSATEKTKVVNNFKRFLKNDCSQTTFTKALYQHLHLHCGFIAHYNINGFYDTYFNGDKDDFLQFCKNFLDEDYLRSPYSYAQDMSDINMAMSIILEEEFVRLVKPFIDKTKLNALLEVKRLMQHNDITINEVTK